VAHNVVTGETLRFDTDCFVGDDTAADVLLVCGQTIKVGRDPAMARVIAPATPDGSGHWAGADLSPDGASLLATHSGECEALSAWNVDIGSGEMALVGPPNREWDSSAMGWLPDGQKVVLFGPGVCGTALPNGPGVYLVAGIDGLTPVYSMPSDVYAWGAILWSAPL
jgi:hypothetical protein